MNALFKPSGSLWTKQSKGTGTALAIKENFFGSLLGLSPTPQYPGRNIMPRPALFQLETPYLCEDENSGSPKMELGVILPKKINII